MVALIELQVNYGCVIHSFIVVTVNARAPHEEVDSSINYVWCPLSIKRGISGPGSSFRSLAAVLLATVERYEVRR